MEIRAVLSEIGFEDREINIYLSLLKNGPLTQQEISIKTGILRQTIYDEIKKMVDKGRVSVSYKVKKKLYSAVPPEILLSQIQEKEDLLKESIPQFKGLMDKTNLELATQTFIGLNGLKNLFNLTLNSKEEILWIANQKQHDIQFNDFYWKNYALKRHEKKIPIRLLIETGLKEYWKTNPKLLRKTKKHDLVKDFSSSLVIYEDKTIIYSQKEGELFGVYLQNESIAKMFKQLFEYLWKTSKG